MIGYIDPSVMTYTIQIVAGVAIAIGAFVGIYFRKAKKKINNKLGIDENKNKEVETDEIVVKKNKKSQWYTLAFLCETKKVDTPNNMCYYVEEFKEKGVRKMVKFKFINKVMVVSKIRGEKFNCFSAQK